jgi:hypothetical protein
VSAGKIYFVGYGATLTRDRALCDGGFDLKDGLCKMWEETSKIQVVEPQEGLIVSCRGDSGDTRFTVTRLPHPTRDKSHGIFTFAYLHLLIQDKNDVTFTVVYPHFLIQDERDGLFIVTHLPHPTRDGKPTATNRSIKKKGHYSVLKHCIICIGGSLGMGYRFLFFFHLL